MWIQYSELLKQIIFGPLRQNTVHTMNNKLALNIGVIYNIPNNIAKQCTYSWQWQFNNHVTMLNKIQLLEFSDNINKDVLQFALSY